LIAGLQVANGIAAFRGVRNNEIMKASSLCKPAPASIHLVFIALFYLCLGCGPKNELGRLPVSGKLSLNGAPLEKGTILFAPEQSRGVSSGADVLDGAYAIEEHKGLTPGTYVVRIYAADEEGEDVEPQLPGPGIKTKRERIPPKYNLRSELKLVVEASQDEAVFDLDMKSN